MARRKKTEPASAERKGNRHETADGAALEVGQTVHLYSPHSRRLVAAKVHCLPVEHWGYPRAVIDGNWLVACASLYSTEAAARAAERRGWQKSLRLAVQQAANARRHLAALTRKPRATKRTKRKEA